MALCDATERVFVEIMPQTRYTQRAVPVPASLQQRVYRVLDAVKRTTPSTRLGNWILDRLSDACDATAIPPINGGPIDELKQIPVTVRPRLSEGVKK